MAKQQEDFLAKQAAMASSGREAGGSPGASGFPTGTDGQVEYGFRRQAKRALFMDQVFERKRERGDEQGKGKGKG